MYENLVIVMLEEHMAITFFLRVNLLITVEDKPTLAPLLVCVAMLKRLLGLLVTLCYREWLAEYKVKGMHVQMKSHVQRRMHELNHSRVESVHELKMTNYNIPRFGGIQGSIVWRRKQVGMKAAADRGAQGH